MGSSIIELIRLGSNLSVLVPLAVYLIVFRIAPKQNHLIALLIVTLGLFDLGGFIFSWHHLPTALLFNIGQVVQFTILSWYFVEVIFKKEKKQVLVMGTTAYIVSSVLVTIFMQGIFQYQSLAWAVGNLLIVLYGILYLRHIAQTLPYWSLEVRSSIWFTAAIVIYFSMNFCLYILGNYILSSLDKNDSMTIWCFHNAHNILKNVLFAVGMYYTGKKINS